MTLITLLILLTIPAFAPEFRTLPVERPESVNQFLPIWNAVKIVESGNNPDTINYTEAAYGAGQIRQDKLNDFNRANNTAYTLKDCLNEEISRKVFFWHCRGYKDIDRAILRWNGAGVKAEKYYLQVQKYLLSL